MQRKKQQPKLVSGRYPVRPERRKMKTLDVLTASYRKKYGVLPSWKKLARLAGEKIEQLQAELEGELPEIKLCNHAAHNWNAVYQCRGCGEIVPEDVVQKVERNEAGQLNPAGR